MSTFSKVRQITIRFVLKTNYNKNFFHTFFQSRLQRKTDKMQWFNNKPKMCVCAYEMCTLDILDIFKKTAPKENGSLDHVDGKINSAYSLVEKFP